MMSSIGQRISWVRSCKSWKTGLLSTMSHGPSSAHWSSFNTPLRLIVSPVVDMMKKSDCNWAIPWFHEAYNPGGCDRTLRLGCGSRSHKNSGEPSVESLSTTTISWSKSIQGRMPSTCRSKKRRELKVGMTIPSEGMADSQRSITE